ncbi:DEKNAAC104990 [Brettanomyces naardenensis]|uniref:DEKNAAC104990 n=1 Tax=Brettanomyces naardenensis TaxID=13370 RepID=A0A448YSC1_BRENA|nr:DEKNAAC104990 [Brettanomyces naardenensis]
MSHLAVTATHANIIIGCTAAVISSACQSIGLILQRKAHLLSQGIDNGKFRMTSPYKRSLWHVGFLLFIFANIFGSTIQITNLPLIVLSPLQSTGLVFNTIFHSIILHEPFTFGSLVGTIFVSVGAFFIAFFGGQVAEPDTDSDTFMKLLRQRSFIEWAVLDAVVVVLFLSWIIFTEWQMETRRSRRILRVADESSHTLLTPKSYRTHSLPLVNHSKLYNLLFNYPVETLRDMQGILYGCVSGTLSAHSLLLAKSVVDILVSSFTKHQLAKFNSVVTYLIVTVFLVLCLSQLYFLNQGLKRISTAVLYPLIFCIYNIVSIGNGLIFYQQWQVISRPTEFWILLGTSMVIYGVFLLSGASYENEQSDLGHIPTPTISSPSATSIYGSISGPSPITEDPGLTSFEEIACSAEPTAYDASSNNNNAGGLLQSISGSLPLSSTPRSLSNANEFLTPIIRSTTDNLNSAGRKVSGFLKRSIGSFHGGKANDSGLSRTPSRRKSVAVGAARSRSPSDGVMPEYVSFGSLKDSSSFINNYDVSNVDADTSFGSQDETMIHSVDSTSDRPSPGLNIFHTKRGYSHPDQPKNVHKSKSSISLHSESRRRTPSLFNSFNLGADQTSPSRLRSPTMSKKRRSALHVSTDFQHEAPIGPNGAVTVIRDNRMDEDYNPNNMFNYSLSNTIEEIQNQMNNIDSKASQILKAERAGKESEMAPNESPQRQIHFPDKQITSETTPTPTRYQPFKNDKLYVAKNGRSARNFTTGILRDVGGHRRALSFEQSELLNELTGTKDRNKD